MNSVAEVDDDSCLALITARAGSKGLPGKNIIDLGGLPLIAYAISAAKQAKSVNRVVVSTDGEAIAAAARAHGAEVPFMRPAELAEDTSPHIDSLVHALEQLAAEEPPYRPKWICLLQPTSPFNTAEDIDAAMEMATSQGGRSVISVRTAQQHPFKMFCANEDGALESLVIANTSFPKEVEYLRRQDLPEAYQENGAIYIHLAQDILDAAAANRKDLPFRRLCGEKACYGHVMSSAASLDIDTWLDLEIAELRIQKVRQESAEPGTAPLGEEAALRERIRQLEKELEDKNKLIEEQRRQLQQRAPQPGPRIPDSDEPTDWR